MKYHNLFYNPHFAPMDTAAAFDASFKAKYGKSYLAAEDEMRDTMFPRVWRIFHLLGEREDFTLLDYGTAYGTFLTCLYPTWRGVGVEKVAALVRRAVVLGRDVHLSTPTFFNTVRCDVFTAWNVIEHVPNLAEFFGHVRASLVRGGLLCISTPNAAGGFFRFRRDEYEKADAADHVWHFTPRSLKRLLESEGFKVVKVVVTGHHPARWGGALWLSKLLRLGDTFECYCRRKT